MVTGRHRHASTLRRALPLAAALTLGFSATAVADISGTVTTPDGGPISSAKVELKDATGAVISTDFTDSLGKYEFPTTTVDNGPGPYTLAAEESDDCRDFRDTDRLRTAQTGPVNDGAIQDIQLDVRSICTTFFSSTLPRSTAFVDTENQKVVGAPGTFAYLSLNISSRAEGVAITLPDGTPIGGLVPNQTRVYRMFLPKGGYSGPFQVSYTVEGSVVSHTLGTIESKRVKRSPAFPGSFDLINIVDISGSMSGNDREKRRADAMDLVLRLSSTGDYVGAVGFDSKRRSIFKFQRITPSKVGRLARVARSRTINRGGTDYDVAFDYAYETLAAKGVNQKRPKAAIFLTDGGHNGTYENSHLKFSYNGTGRTWPVCVVQLGRSFQSGDVARLKRIARETGGIYVKAPNNAKLTDVYFQCRGTNAGDKTFGKKTWRVKKGQQRTLTRKLPKGLKQATFFAGWGAGRFSVNLIDPAGRTITPAKAKRMKAVSYRRGRTFAFYNVTRPKKGTWRLKITARKVKPGTTDTLSTTLTGARK
jgi:Mg-chelatase subunit ChlD